MIGGYTGCPKKMSVYKKVIQHVNEPFFGTPGTSWAHKLAATFLANQKQEGMSVSRSVHICLHIKTYFLGLLWIFDRGSIWWYPNVAG